MFARLFSARQFSAGICSALAVAAVLAVPPLAAAGGHCDSGSYGSHDQADCRYKWVARYRIQAVVTYKTVVKYDDHGAPYLAKVAYRAKVRVPYRVRVKVCG